MKTHTLNTDAAIWDAVSDGRMTAYTAYNEDKLFQAGDIVILKRTDAIAPPVQPGWNAALVSLEKETLTPTLTRRITFVLPNNPRYGLNPGYVVFGMEPVQPEVNKQSISDLISKTVKEQLTVMSTRAMGGIGGGGGAGYAGGIAHGAAPIAEGHGGMGIIADSQPAKPTPPAPGENMCMPTPLDSHGEILRYRLALFGLFNIDKPWHQLQPETRKDWEMAAAVARNNGGVSKLRERLCQFGFLIEMREDEQMQKLVSAHNYVRDYKGGYRADKVWIGARAAFEAAGNDHWDTRPEHMKLHWFKLAKAAMECV